MISPALVRDCREHVRTLEQLAERLSDACDERNDAHRRLMAFSGDGDPAEFARLVFEADAAEARRKLAAIDYADARAAASPSLVSFFRSWCDERGIEIESERPLLQAIRGGR